MPGTDPPAAERVVLCFGDSNTHGTLAMTGPDDMRRLPPDQRWPGVTAAALGPGWRVIEEGHPGRTTVHDDPIEGAHKNGALALAALLETHRPIDLVVMMLGTNDLKARFAVTPEDIARSVERLLADIAASNAGPGQAAPAVLLVAPVAIAEAGWLAGMFRGGAAKARALSAELAATAQRLGLPFVDADALATVDPVDGVHLGAEAHDAIGRAIAAKVAEVMG